MAVEMGCAGGRMMGHFGSKLKVLNLRECSISKTPDFSAFPSLESLILESCGELVWVDSIVLLKNLILINLRRCWRLEKLPEQLGSMESLVELLIDDTRVKELPILRASVGSLVNLRRLSLSHSGVEELPNSIGQLTSLVELILTGTDIRSCLPGNLGSLKKLKVLDASWSPLMATEYQIISDEILSLSSLRVLKLNMVKSLLADMSTLSCLETLYLFKTDLQTLPELPSSLISLTVRLASALTSLNLANLVNLKELILDENWKLKELESVSSFSKLERMALYSVEISTLPEEIELESLQKLDISSCRSLRKLPNLSKLQRLELFSMSDCESIMEIPGLEELSNLRELNIFGCKALKLPDLSKQQSVTLRT
ncbi:hypothetical protein CRG98_043509 [Punica granatum]|uniref:Disease resistance R13L4/SHOC-2-like LRR domain-containing protein n=1 Tax=Punica granatum TaxID=22663 RepID=A0A2I0HXV5_PUNGR|nr:hypothetical protein CRG98_043509 [Punica granatum]